MDRLRTMARFNESVPPEPEPFDYCNQCGEPLYSGHRVFCDGRSGDYYCDVICFQEYIKANIIDEVYDYVDLLWDRQEVYIVGM